MKQTLYIKAFFIISIFLLPGCFAKKSNTRKKTIIMQHTEQTYPLITIGNNHQQPTITVWIHGTRLFPRPIFKEYFKSRPGLVKARELSPDSYLSKISYMLNTADPQQFDLDHLYIFGWSGKLCFKERQQTAEYLYTTLINKAREYHERYNQQPRIILLCHSHGGNVALNLANIHHTHTIIIDELIMIACPVQQQTLHCIKDPLFKNIYALYSTIDTLQVLDPQGLYKQEEKTALFSKRLFPHQDNLAQIKIRLNGRAIFHNEFILEKFLHYLPKTLDHIRQWHKQEIAYESSGNPVYILSIRTI